MANPGWSQPPDQAWQKVGAAKIIAARNVRQQDKSDCSEVNPIEG
jgi:hypothetical protein